MLRFEVCGSTGELYQVEAERIGQSLRITCNCHAASNGVHCHHRLELLAGDTSAIASANVDDVNMLGQMLVGSTLEAALVDLRKAEAIQKTAKLERDRRMRAVDRLLAARAD